MHNSTRAWLYVRGSKSIRVVMDSESLSVYGPGETFRRQQCQDAMAATFEHDVIEQELVRNGWSLEQLTTERRSGHDRRSASRGVDRRHAFRLVGDYTDTPD